jgi:hypothetical protein
MDKSVSLAVSKILEDIESLDEHERSRLLEQIKPCVNIIFPSISQKIVIAPGQCDLSESLELIPLECLGELLRAIGSYIMKHDC